MEGTPPWRVPVLSTPATNYRYQAGPHPMALLTVSEYKNDRNAARISPADVLDIFRPENPPDIGFFDFPCEKIERLSMAIPGEQSAWVKTVKPERRTRNDLDRLGQSDMATSK